MSITLIPKEAVTQALIGEWSALRQLAATLDDDQWSAPSVLPAWSNADIIAHVVGTESMLSGREVEAPAELADREHVHNPVGELNEKWVHHFHARPREDVLAAFDSIVAERISALAAISTAEFDTEQFTPAGPDSYGRFMRIRLFDCWMHEVDLRDAIGAEAPADPQPVGWVLDEVAASLPFVVGKRAGAPTGSRVVFDITGPAPRVLRVEVAQRASIVEAFEGGDDAADVTLRVDVVEFARLIGGRRDANPHAVHIIGDRELGERIVSRLDYMI